MTVRNVALSFPHVEYSRSGLFDVSWGFFDAIFVKFLSKPGPLRSLSTRHYLQKNSVSAKPDVPHIQTPGYNQISFPDNRGTSTQRLADSQDNNELGYPHSSYV